MFRNRSANVHQFSMVPRAEVPRASFRMEHSHKTTFNASYLIPVFWEEVLPGDTMRLKMTAFCRMSTPIYPIMDNLYMDSFFFFVPNRLLWDNWKRFMGEQDSPGASISYTVPLTYSPVGGYAAHSIGDYFGLPTVGQCDPGIAISHIALPMRAYNLIFNEWFRDENLVSPAVKNTDDGPDAVGDYLLRKRGKRHDYFTSALPWPQKGNTAVSIPLGTEALVKTYSPSDTVPGGGFLAQAYRNVTTGAAITTGAISAISGGVQAGSTPAYLDVGRTLYADLSNATAATINQLRQAFQIQKLLERDARGGTRYTELVRAHFGVLSPDARLQRPEYLGGGTTPVSITPIAQTSATGVSGGTSPLGNLSAVGTILSHGHGFSQSFTEHGHIIGLVNVRADLTYQQGTNKKWLRQTRYDYYFPAFAMLGEQIIQQFEIFDDGTSARYDVFGYQERWAEYRYHPSLITGLFRSTTAGTLDAWHLAQNFSDAPVLDASFIEETVPMSRILAAADTQPHFIADMLFSCIAARPLPMYSVPGLIDHF